MKKVVLNKNNTQYTKGFSSMNTHLIYHRLAIFLLLFGIGFNQLFAQQPGNALSFDGTNDHVSLPNAVPQALTTSNVSAITIAYWFRGSNNLSAVRIQNGSGFIIAGYGGNHVISTDGGTGNGLPIGSSVTDGRWHYVTMTWQRNTVNGFKSYLDGQLVAQRNAANVALPVLNNGAFLGSNNGFGEFTNGSLDEVRIYTVARTEAEIRLDMINSPIAGLPAGLLAYYKFNQGVAAANNNGINSLTDFSSNAHHGTLINFALSGTNSNWIESYALVVPDSLAATNITSNGFTVNWNAPQIGLVNNYFIEVSTNRNFITQVQGSPFSAAASARSIQVSNLKRGTYFYRIRANKTSVNAQGAPSAIQEIVVPYVAPGNALRFDGTNDFVSLPASLSTQFTHNSNTGITIMYWFRGSSSQSAIRIQNGNNFIIAGWNGRHVISNDGGTGNGLEMGDAATDGRWHHVAMTWQRNTINGFKSYLDGQLVAQRNAANVALPSVTTLGYLGSLNGSSEFLNGSLDEVKLFRVALNQSNIQALMVGANSNISDSSLLANYTFDQGVDAENNITTTQLLDASTNAFNGTLTHFSLTGVNSNWIESYAMVVPSIGAASGITTNGFTANWNAPLIGSFDNYILEVFQNPNLSSQVPGSPFSVQASALSYVVSGLLPGTYYYRVSANKNAISYQGCPSQLATVTLPYISPGNALNFDGINDYISIPHNAQAHNLSKVTIEAWVFWSPATSTEVDFICSKGSNEVLEIHTGGGAGANGLRFIPRPGLVIDVPNALIPNKWNFIAFMFDPSISTAKTYVNGTDRFFTVSSGNLSSALTNNTGPLNIGRRADNSLFFKGAIDEFRIWNTLRTAEEVLQDMASTVPANEPGIMAYYNFNNGIAGQNNAGVNQVADLSSRGNTGTLLNFGLSGANSNWIQSYAMVVPISLPATQITGTSFTANWLAPLQGTVNNYFIDVSLFPDFSIPIAGSPFTVSNTTLSRQFTGLLNNTNYYYRVRAENSVFAGQGGASATQEASTRNLMPPPGNALALDGTGDFVNIPHASGINNEFGNHRITMESWVYLKSHPTGSRAPAIVTEGWDGNIKFAIYQYQGGLYAGFHHGSWTQAELTEPLPLNRWVHVAATYDKATIKLYVNGELLATKTSTLNLPEGNNDWRIGRRWDFDECVNGFIDEVKIYNEALTSEQINRDMLDTGSVLPANLVLYYDMDQGAAGANNAGLTIATDRSRNRRNGNLNNFSLSGTASNWIASYSLVLPKAIEATNITNNSFTARWEVPIYGSASSYFLDVSTTKDFSGQIVGSPFTLDGTSFSRNIQNLVGGDYYYRVRANNTNFANQGGASNVIKVRVPYTPPGNALAFDGSNDYVKLPDGILNGLTNATFEIWFFNNGSGIWSRTFDFGRGESNFITFVPRSDNANLPTLILRVNGDDKRIFLPSALETNRWYHVAAVVDATNNRMRCFLNGELVGEISNVTRRLSQITNNTQNWLGRSQFGHDPFFRGRLDEFRIWNVVRTQAQIQATMRDTLIGNEPNLIAYYNFENGIDASRNVFENTLLDKTANSRNGDLINFALTGAISNWVASYALTAPKALEATQVSASGFTANWEAPIHGRFDNYFLDVSSDSIFSSPIIGSPFLLPAASLNRVFSNMLGGTYYYRIRAQATPVNIAGQGAYSKTIKVFVPYTPPGNAIAFNGTNNRLKLNNTALGNFGASNFTIEFWMRSNDQNGGYLISKRDQCGHGSFFVISMGNNGINIEMDQNTNGSNYLTRNGTRPVNDGRWHHVAVVRQGVNYKTYIDGVVDINANTSGITHISNGNSIDMGVRYCHNLWYEGSLDEVRIWNTARTAEQLVGGMKNAIDPAALNLQGYFKFDQGIGGEFNYSESTFFDATPNNNHGRLIDFRLEAQNSNWVESYAMVVPTQLEPTNVTPTSFTLNWAEPIIGSLSGYRVDVSLTANFSAPIPGSPFTVTGNTLDLDNLAPSKFYCRVRANLSNSPLEGQGAPSNVKLVTLEYVPPGNALKFDGQNDVGSIPRQISEDFTIEYWIKTNENRSNINPTARGIVDMEVGGASGDFRNTINGGKVTFGVGVNGIDPIMTSNTTINTGQWYHVAMTRQKSNGQIRLYINGNLEETGISGTGNITAASAISLGATRGFPGNQDYSSNIALDELRIWNVVRTPAQIFDNFRDTVDRNSTGLIQYYNFDQGIGDGVNTNLTNLIDIAGDNAVGTISNFGLIGNNSNWIKSYNISVTAPTNLTATQNNCSTIELEWQIGSGLPTTNCDASIHCDQSNFQQYVFADGNLIAKYPYNTSSAVFHVNRFYNGIKLERGIQYRFTVATVYTPPLFKLERLSTPSNTAIGQFKPNPDIPSGFTASDTKCDGSIDLNWSWNTVNPMFGFLIERSLDTNMLTPILINQTGDKRSYSDPGLQRGSVYFYRIRARNECYVASAVDSMRAGESDTMVAETGISPSVPNRPSNIRLFPDSINNTITIRWNDNSTFEEKFSVERVAVGGGSYSVDVNANDTVFVDDQAPGCVNFNYSIKAYSACAVNGISTLGLNQTRLSPDLSRTFESQSIFVLTASKGYYSNRVELKWKNRNSGQLNFIRIYRKIANSTNDSILIASVLPGSDLYIDNSAVAGVLYRYFLIGEAQCAGTTVYSNWVSDIGFRSPSGTVNGSISFAGGFAVENVRVLAQNTSFNRGGGIALDGIDDYLEIPHQASQDAKSLTIEAWFKPIIDRSFVIAEKTDSLLGGYRLAYNSNVKQLQFTVSNGTANQTVFVDSPFVSFTSYSQITVTCGADSIRIYVNGLEGKTVLNELGEIGLPQASLLLGASKDLAVYSFGNLDEVRLWKYAKTKAEIARDFNRTVTTNHKDLFLYLNFDDRFDGLTQTYDQSNLNEVYNGNHATLQNGAVYTDSIPSNSQLALADYTDENGLYSIRNVRYLGTGQNYTIVPSLDIHTFTPQNRILFIGDGAQVANNINFTDNSSFEFTGTVKYAGTSCPASGATVLIDGRSVLLNNRPVLVNDSGKFVVRVPIGLHQVSLEHNNHVFSQGTFPPSGNYNFMGPVAATFVDSTFLKVVGRVVGGNRELNKAPGLGRSKNNIGKAQFTFNSLGQLGLSDCFVRSIITNDTTGEYTTYLLPLRYSINGLKLVNNPDPTLLTQVAFNNPNVLDLSIVPELITVYDTLVTPLFSRADSIQFHRQLDFKYYVTPQIYLTNLATDFDSLVNNFIGETDIKINDSVSFNISNNALGYPVFSENAIYDGIIKVVEIYRNADKAETEAGALDRVPVDGTLRILNSMAPGADQFRSVIMEGGAYKYSFRAGKPNILRNTISPNYSYTKTLQIQFVPNVGLTIDFRPNSTDPISQFYRGIVFGAVAGNSNFVTAGPALVEFILRDPPGSASSATWSQGKSFTSVSSWNLSEAYGIGGGATINSGVTNKVETGVAAIELEIENSIGVELSFNATLNQA
ncbi:MAG: LamG-like jellyroll fold domain-containing protein, partial [Bacteroidota bacterium]|nr:LamG-like jellyroll fold domain-containing protein [Bacteroidota bacterium]